MKGLAPTISAWQDRSGRLRGQRAPCENHLCRARGHDVVSVHGPEYDSLEGAPDDEIFATALAAARALVTENVPDFRRLEADALARGEEHTTFVFTTNRQFPRGEPGTVGRLVEALDALLTGPSMPQGSLFLERPPSS